MKKGNLIYLAVVAAVGVVGYLIADKKAKETKAHKEAKLAEWPHIEDDIQNASLGNENLGVEDRIKAKEVLEYYHVRLLNSGSIATIDKNYQKLTSLLTWIKEGDQDSAVSLVQYEHRQLLKKQQDLEKERERTAELERLRTLGTAFGNLIPDVNVRPVIKNIIGEATKS